MIFICRDNRPVRLDPDIYDCTKMSTWAYYMNEYECRGWQRKWGKYYGRILILISGGSVKASEMYSYATAWQTQYSWRYLCNYSTSIVQCSFEQITTYILCANQSLYFSFCVRVAVSTVPFHMSFFFIIFRFYLPRETRKHYIFHTSHSSLCEAVWMRAVVWT